jgi:hypothetical protein
MNPESPPFFKKSRRYSTTHAEIAVQAEDPASENVYWDISSSITLSVDSECDD